LSVLVRSWNLFHGNTKPPQRHAFLEEAVRRAVSDQPDIVLLQEVSAWALARLREWSGMTAVGDVAQPPTIGPLPSTAEIGRLLTSLHQGVLRSAFSGQANAILLAHEVELVDRHLLVLNPRSFRREQARRHGLGFVARLAWASERRVCQAVRIRLPDGRPALVANMHATSFPPDHRLATVEFERAVGWVDGLAERDDAVIVGGDLNQSVRSSPVLARISERRFSAPGRGIDHILVRGAAVERELATWPDDRRRVDGALLSDHAPVEVTFR
jgi:endonuclease/exonuclease/phosphatase (EEP) superfamily protein YafD